jgi:hypothetical protein
MLYLIEQGVLSVDDTDVAVSYGPGLRWGVMGQSLQWHLGGGEGGIKHFMDHLMEPLAGMMHVLGTPNITPQLKQTVIDGVLHEAAGRSVASSQRRKTVIIGLLRLPSAENGVRRDGEVEALALRRRPPMTGSPRKVCAPDLIR